MPAPMMGEGSRQNGIGRLADRSRRPRRVSTRAARINRDLLQVRCCRKRPMRHAAQGEARSGRC
jgi:hypothetical protein